MKRRLVAIVLASAALVAPCFWHARIEAGDFSSHVYNVWLGDQIRAGRLPGLAVAQPWTNFLFDDILRGLVHLAGYAAGQKIAAALVVLVFFWGAFAFVTAAAGQRPWPVAPLLAIFTYGWVFHTGFFNFLLAAGLSFWALALLWRPTKARAAVALTLFAIAFAAHALAVACGVAIAGYAHIARRASGRRRWLLLAGAAAAVVATRFAISALFPTLWLASQLLNFSGADQAWVFGTKYLVLSALLAFLLVNWVVRARALDDPVVHLCLLSALAVIVLPTRIDLPEFAHALVYASCRLSLFTAVLVSAVAARARPRLPQAIVSGALAAAFFAFLYFDTGALNRIEDSIDKAAARIPPGSRVVQGMFSVRPFCRLDPIRHALDRACIGRCYSYGNYEPSTRQFRVRALGPNPFVASDYQTAWALESGTYRVAERDRPLYAVYPCPGGACARQLDAGEIVRVVPVGY